MEQMKFKLVDNRLKAEDFLKLKTAAGFLDRPIEQVDKALRNGLFNVVAFGMEMLWEWEG